MRNFFDNNHAHGRLIGCYAWYKGKGFFIQRADKKYIEDEHGTRYELKDKNLTLCPERMGYVNSNTTCYYLSRKSVRQWKVGVRCNNTACFSYDGRAGNNADRMFCKLDKPYPSMARCLAGVRDRHYHAMAFHHRFAIGQYEDSKYPVLYYRTKPVGWFNEKSQLVMGDTNAHLLQQLHEVVPNLEVLM